MSKICEDENCTNVAKHQIITEYSCFGHEYADLCELHYTEHVEATRNGFHGFCDLCGGESSELKRWQDPEEGSSAAYRDTCRGCRMRMSEAFTHD